MSSHRKDTHISSASDLNDAVARLARLPAGRAGRVGIACAGFCRSTYASAARSARRGRLNIRVLNPFGPPASRTPCRSAFGDVRPNVDPNRPDLQRLSFQQDSSQNPRSRRHQVVEHLADTVQRTEPRRRPRLSGR